MKRAWILLAAMALQAADAQPPKFEQQVLPIFTTYCFTCHGQSSAKLGLDLRTAGTALRGSFNGPVIVPGKPDESLLWKKVSTKQMPPAIYGQKVPDADIATIKAWIEAGAPSDAPAGELAKEAEAQRARFDRDVQPVLKARCAGCHGGAKPAAGLAVDSMAAVLKGAANGPVVVEGFSQKSALVRRVTNKTMPPPQAGAPLSEKEIRAISEWIDRGNFGESTAHAMDREFTPLEAPPITAEQRKFWAFRKPVAAAPPKVKAEGRVRTPIDRFLLAKLEAAGLSYSPDAPAQKLLRRAYLDLTGLPPTPAQTEEFLRDSATPGAYERLVDKLLDSPHYGERWGRHWLDTMGYVDTTGKDFQPDKPDFAEGMWRYRDYVIQAFNRDTPWNQFLTEQIAGDELIDWRAARGEYTPRMIELLTATGYLRNILDITHEDISNLPVERYEALFKLADTVGGSALGLTVGCARCHSHKFDPISQRDYYRFLALFTNAYNPSDWIQPQNRNLWTIPADAKEAVDKHNKQFDEPLAELKKKISALRQPYEKKLRAAKAEKALPAIIRADVIQAVETADAKRDEVQKYLASRFGAELRIAGKEVDEAMSAADRASQTAFEAETKAIEAKKKTLQPIQALWDVGKPPLMRLLQRGSAEAPGPRVTPGFLEILMPAGADTNAAKPAEAVGATSGMRLAFARWLTSPDHPLTARVIVNRAWQGHFGTGIVATPDNFGMNGAAPTHPELLDYLAVEFMRNGWSLKKLHKLIMTSTVYRQSAVQQGQPWLAKAQTMDPNNALLWHMNLRRLDAEPLRDSIIAAAGKLDVTAGGPPILLDARPDGELVVSAKEPAGSEWRRSVYLLSRRNYPVTFLGAFDFPTIDTTCARRTPSATPLQSLAMMNDNFVWRAAEALAKRAENSVEAAYQIVLARAPSPAEREQAQAYLREHPFRSFAQALLSSNEFLYID